MPLVCVSSRCHLPTDHPFTQRNANLSVFKFNFLKFYRSSFCAINSFRILLYFEQRHIIMKPASDISSTFYTSVSMFNNFNLSSLMPHKRQTLTVTVCRFIVPLVKLVGENSLFHTFKKFFCYEMNLTRFANMFPQHPGAKCFSKVPRTFRARKASCHQTAIRMF